MLHVSCVRESAGRGCVTGFVELLATERSEMGVEVGDRGKDGSEETDAERGNGARKEKWRRNGGWAGVCMCAPGREGGRAGGGGEKARRCSGEGDRCTVPAIRRCLSQPFASIGRWHYGCARRRKAATEESGLGLKEKDRGGVGALGRVEN